MSFSLPYPALSSSDSLHHMTCSLMLSALSAVTNRKFDGHTPSASYMNKLTHDMKYLACKQVKEGIDGADVFSLTYDRTTKKGHILTEVELEMQSGTYLCGVREQVDGTAEETAEIITDILDDISAIKSTEPSAINTLLHAAITRVHYLRRAWSSNVSPSIKRLAICFWPTKDG